MRFYMEERWGSKCPAWFPSCCSHRVILRCTQHRTRSQVWRLMSVVARQILKVVKGTWAGLVHKWFQMTIEEKSRGVRSRDLGWLRSETCWRTIFVFSWTVYTQYSIMCYCTCNKKRSCFLWNPFSGTSAHVFRRFGGILTRWRCLHWQRTIGTRATNYER